MADNVNETSNIERVDNRDPFENANNVSEARKAYFRQDSQLYTGQYADDDDRKWTDTDSWIDNPDFISNADFSVFSAITKKLLAGKLRPLTRSNRVVTVGFGTV